ncbi:hypothetical protein ACSSS7_007813 [Eimeria intestinalis]
MASLRVAVGAATAGTPAAQSAGTKPTTGSPHASAAALEELKQEGNDKFKAGDYAGAAEAYSRCIDGCNSALSCVIPPPSSKREGGGHPPDGAPAEGPPTREELRGMLAAAYCNRCMCRLKQEDAKGAVADSKAALDIQPDYPKALYRSAVALHSLGDLNGAVSSLRRLMRVDPKNTDGCRLLLQLKETLLRQEEKQHNSMLPSSLIDTALDAAAPEAKRVKALRDLGRLVQERHALQETVAKEGLLQRVAIFSKQQNAAKTPPDAAPAPAAPAAAAPAAVEAAGWEFVSSVLQYTALGDPSSEGSSSSSSATKERVLFKVNEPLSIPIHVKRCREAMRRTWTSEDFLLTCRRLLRLGVVDPPADYFTSIFAPKPSNSTSSSNSSSSSSSSNGDARRWRGLSVLYLLRSFGYLKQSEADAFEHDSSFLECVSSGLDCGEAPGVQLAALQALAAAADARRRLGLKAKALALRHGIERSLEAVLALLSAAADRARCGAGGPQIEALERSAELTVVTVLSLLGDKERAEADKVDMQRLADQLLSPFLSHCNSRDPSKQSEAFVGLKALRFLMTADRDSARHFIVEGTLLPYILSAATGEAAARAGLSGTQQQQQQQQVATEVLLQCLDHLELRQKLLDDDGIEALLKMLRDDTRPPSHRAKLAVALARICVHSKTTKTEILERIDLFTLLQDLLQQQQQQQQQQVQQQHHQHQRRKEKGKEVFDDEFGLCVLELFFFLSLHAEFKAKLLESGQQRKGRVDVLDAIMELGSHYCCSTKSSNNSSSTNSTSSSSSSSSSSMPRYLLCGGLSNLLKSRADKDTRPKKSNLQGGMDLDEGQLRELEAFYEQLPPEAKPIPNGEVDPGDEDIVVSLRAMLLQRGFSKLLARACMQRPLPSPNVLLAAGRAFYLWAKDEKARGRMVQEGVLGALLTAIGALKSSPEYQRDLQQAAAQLCISVNPSLLAYHEALDLIPALMPLLCEGHELLQYEGALALTNLTSVSEEVQQRAFAAGAWCRFSDLVFSENDLLRAAGLEGCCNLAGCRKVQEILGEKAKKNEEIQDLRLLLAFCLETANPRAQQAAAGALATLLQNSCIAQALPRYDGYKNLFVALDEAKEEEGPLLDRLVACMYNVWADDMEGEEEGIAVKHRIEEALNKNKDKLNGLAADLTNQILPSTKEKRLIVNKTEELQRHTAHHGMEGRGKEH